MKGWLLVLGLGCMGTAKAQSSEGLYAAPGMRVHLQRRVVPTARKPIAEPAPLVSPRFWKFKDSAFVKAAGPFYQYVGSRFRWPETTMKAGIEGRIVVRLSILPNGSVAQAALLDRTLAQATGYSKEEGWEKGQAALEAEALRFMKLLRFEPAAIADTIAVPLTLRMQ